MLQGFGVTLGGLRGTSIYLSIHSDWYTKAGVQDELCPGDTQQALAQGGLHISQVPAAG